MKDEKALETWEQQIIQFPDVEFTSTSMKVGKALKIESAMVLAEGLYKISKAHQFWWGDFLNATEKLYGEEYAQLVPDQEMIDTATLRKWKWVAEKIKPKHRKEKLSYTHHEIVAGMDDEDKRIELLKQANKEGLTTSALKKLIKPAKEKDIPNETCPACGEIFPRGSGKTK